MADRPPARSSAGGITAETAAFVAATRFADIPAAVVERGKVHILDALGLALVGAGAEASRIVRGHLAALGGDGATVLGTAMRAAPRFAALANGAAVHADNFDDTNPQPSPQRNGGIHATGAVLPAVLALAEPDARPGRDVIEAFHVGVEVACKLNHAIAARHYEGGFHATGTLNAFGAAAAAARLMGLEAAGVGHALACAASLAAGIRGNFGAMVEQLHPGFAAESGVVAADLARRGLSGGADILEAPLGWFAAAGGGFEADAIAGRLGRPWAFADPGMWIKPFPSGALTHPAMTLLLDLVREHGIVLQSVRRVRVATNRRIAATLVHDRPRSALEARFSMPFCLAVLLVEGRAGLAEFTDEVVNRADIREMMRRIDYRPFETEAPDYTNVTTFLDVETADGTVHSGRADHALGSTRRPMDFARVAEKFAGCAAHAGWPAEKAGAVAAVVDDLENLDDIRALTALLAA